MSINDVHKLRPKKVNNDVDPIKLKAELDLSELEEFDKRLEQRSVKPSNDNTKN